MVSLPIKNNGYIDFDFMESFIAELEAERVAELSAYLTVSGLDNYESYCCLLWKLTCVAITR